MLVVFCFGVLVVCLARIFMKLRNQGKEYRLCSLLLQIGVAVGILAVATSIACIVLICLLKDDLDKEWSQVYLSAVGPARRTTF